MIKFKGSFQFRARLVGALLSSKSVSIRQIRESDSAPGLREYEVSFLKLLDELTDGTQVSINPTGTSVTFSPGLVKGGTIEFDCSNTGRSIGYFIEGILPVCLFSKRVTTIHFTGVTSDDMDICIETLNYVTLPLLSRFGLEPEELPQIKLTRRGCPPNGFGSAVFICPIVRQLKPVELLDVGYVKKIRGVAHAVRVNPQVANRMVDSCRGVLNNFIPDVYINTDHSNGTEIRAANGATSKTLTGRGFGILLYAESTNGFFYGAKRIAQKETPEEDVAVIPPRTGVEPLMDPEDLGLNAAKQLCEEISHGGCIDSSHQSLLMLMMVLCPEDVSKARIGPLSAYSVEFLRLVKTLFEVKFKLVKDDSNVIISCRGIGFKNLSRKVT
mmetsp:Transcript_1566/g.1784  ORF Transcript_1566/g.1784 Transcript_1566/m.1784 type:complete len:385 (+) Transcript_1566:78-1232(+)